MDLPSNPLPECQLHCTVCQDVFTDPVATPCGHSFCKACLTSFWDGSDMCQCPLCRKRFVGPLDLSVNTVLDQISQDFKRRRLDSPKAGSKCEAKDSRLPSLSSLSDEEAQSCSTEDLWGKPLLNLKDSLCNIHNQPLELFCSTDYTCICTLCVEEGHGEHTIAPVEREWLHRHNELRTQVLQVKQGILDRQKKMEEIKQNTRLSREDADKELKEGLQILNALLRSVEDCQAELPKVIEGKQKAVESRAQNLLEELEQEIRDLKARKAELKQLLSSQDYVRFLESLFLWLPPFSRDWDNVIVHADLCAGTVRSAISLQEENLREKMRELMDAEFQKIQQYAEEVTLEPQTAHHNQVVSHNEKQVYRPDGLQLVFEKLDRLHSVRNLLGKQMLSSGRHYWEVEVEGKTSWYLGVVTASITRKGKVMPQPQNGLWLLHQKGRQSLEALGDSCVKLNLSSELKKVGVYVDYEEGLISFYNAEARSPIFSFTGNTFTEELLFALESTSK